MKEYKRIDSVLYGAYMQQCDHLAASSLFLPEHFQPNLWGIVALENNIVIGGWIGKLRGNKPLIGYFVKGVWFDSLPVFFESNHNETNANQLLYFAKQQALEDNIVTLNVTHWSRKKVAGIFDIPEQSASFIIDLNATEEELWSHVTTKLRTVIRKGEKTEVEVFSTQGEASLAYLSDFQRLRQNTQSRAISKNAQASMLLKSNQFFSDLLVQPGSYFYVARYEGEVVAMALMVESGGTVYYFSGGSNLQANKKTGASSYLIWKAILGAKSIGCHTFDMGGVPVQPDETHPAYGVYFFKKSYGGVYEEYSSGKIIVRKKIYPLLNFVLKNRALLRMISKRE